MGDGEAHWSADQNKGSNYEVRKNQLADAASPFG
jgi:hypothetical protein